MNKTWINFDLVTLCGRETVAVPWGSEVHVTDRDSASLRVMNVATMTEDSWTNMWGAGAERCVARGEIISYDFAIPTGRWIGLSDEFIVVPRYKEAPNVIDMLEHEIKLAANDPVRLAFVRSRLAREEARLDAIERKKRGA